MGSSGREGGPFARAGRAAGAGRAALATALAAAAARAGACHPAGSAAVTMPVSATSAWVIVGLLISGVLMHRARRQQSPSCLTAVDTVRVALGIFHRFDARLRGRP